MITLQNVSKTFHTKHGDIKALQDVDLTIDEGEIFGIIGYSGAGKSTLIRCINLLESPTTGNIIVDKQNLVKLSTKDLRENRKKMGMIFQHFHLLPSRTVAQNVLFPLKDTNLSKEEKHKKVNDLLELVGLLDRKDAYPSALSGGQKQRVAIARALANDPKILLCDEATSALDPQTTKSILRLLKEVNRKLNITIVLITHEMAVIKEICDRVAVMEDGWIKELGDVISIFSNPQSSIAKEFVSSTSSLHKVYELVDSNSPIVALQDNEKLLKLTYTTSNTKEPLVYELSNLYNIKTNIIFGNIEIIKDQPIGNLVVIVQGDTINIEKAIKYMKNEDILVEVINKC
ncbi:MAG: methionine ABC transporter ATP-binding protein [Coprobacillaceae bacterium]